MILLHASGLFAAVTKAQPGHEAARNIVETAREPLILPPLALAELDYLLLTRAGVDAELAFLQTVTAGVYELARFDDLDVAAAMEVIDRYRDQRIGLADASIVVLAGRYGTDRVLTLDERHFRMLRTPSGDPFVILPADC